MQLSNYGSVIFVMIGIVVAVVALASWSPSPKKQLMRCAQQAFDKHELKWFGAPHETIRCYRNVTGEFVVEFLNKNAALPFPPFFRAQADVFVISFPTVEVQSYRMIMTANSTGEMPLPVGNHATPRLPYILHQERIDGDTAEKWAQRLRCALG
ncbi:MAG TPA: hypothetical protein VLG40_03180 [Candidatus Saccharimonas sp.]|nr:hypothetical protein [Candidatus Saccharimonas sp.]